MYRTITNLGNNWLQVLGTAERSQIYQHVRHQLHAIVPLLDAFKPPPPPFERICPRTGPLHAPPPCMDGGVEAALAAALGDRSVARLLCDVGDQVRLADQRPGVRGIKAPIAVARGALQVQAELFGHRLHGLQPVGTPEHRWLLHGHHGDGSSDRAMGVRDGAHWLPRVGFGPRVANALAPFCATVWVPSPWRTLPSRGFAVERWATRAMTACPRDPSWAQVATPWSTGGSGRAGVPWGSVGPGRHGHGLPCRGPPRCDARPADRPMCTPAPAEAARGAGRYRRCTPGRSVARESASWQALGSLCSSGQ